jgi:hypothetical protein
MAEWHNLTLVQRCLPKEQFIQRQQMAWVIARLTEGDVAIGQLKQDVDAIKKLRDILTAKWSVIAFIVLSIGSRSLDCSPVRRFPERFKAAFQTQMLTHLLTYCVAFSSALLSCWTTSVYLVISYLKSPTAVGKRPLAAMLGLRTMLRVSLKANASVNAFS